MIRRVMLVTTCLASALALMACSKPMGARFSFGGASQGATLPDRAAPAGFKLFRDPQGSGAVLYGTFSGNARSATMAAQGVLGNLRGFFDDAPQVRTLVRDDFDQRVQAFFTAALGGKPVSGVIGLELSGGSGFVSVLFDRPEAFASSYSRMRSGFVRSMPQGPPAPQLYPQVLGDGSRISLPQGWRVTFAGKGSVDISGPAGEEMSLGAAAPVYYRQPWGAPPGYVLVGPCCDPVRAMAALVPQISAGMQRMGRPPFRLVRVLEVQPTQPVSYGGQAAFVLSELDVAGHPARGFAWVSAAPAGMEQWVYYTSGVAAPADRFNLELPTMLAIWKSYSINPAVFQERLDNAARNMKQIGQMISDVNAERQHASEAAAEGWDQYIRGVQTVERTDTGRRWQADNQYAEGLVNSLNQSGTGHWRVVPTDELAPRR
jgi:hypothetical protein